MNWFSRLFATRRELKRLASEVKYYRGKAEALEASKNYWQHLVLERDMLFVDRYQTAMVKTYATSEQAKALAQTEGFDERQPDGLTEYLLSYKIKLEQDAMEAGRTMEEAHQIYSQREPALIAEYKEDFGFNN